MMISTLLIYSLICSAGLLLMYGAIRLSRVGLTRNGRWAIMCSVLTVASAAAIPLLLGWQSRPVFIVEGVGPLDFPLTMADGGTEPYRTHCPVWTVDWWKIIGLGYIVGLIVASLRLMITIVRIVSLISRSERVNGVLLTQNESMVPFTWGGRIIMSRADYESYGEILMAHESAHKDAHHWIDLMILNLLGCVTWYCPAARLIRREVQSTHEFAADRAVLAAGFDAKEYQMLLISKASGRRFANSVADCINNHSLKSRIIMMQKNSPMRHRLLRSLTLVPAAMSFIALASSPALASVVGSTMPAKVVISEQKDVAPDCPKIYVDGQQVESMDSLSPDVIDSVTVIKKAGRNDVIVTTKSDLEVAEPNDESSSMSPAIDSPTDTNQSQADAAKDESTNTSDEKVFTSATVSPSFKGGDVKMFQFLTENLRYPEECAKNNIQGRVIVQFVVKKDGSIGDVRVARGVNPELDAEAIRVCKSFPSFEPGKLNGEPVNVWYTLPITFKLSSDDVKKEVE